MNIHRLANKEIWVISRLDSHAEYIVAWSDDDGCNFPLCIIQVLFIDIKIIAHITERGTRFPKNSYRTNEKVLAWHNGILKIDHEYAAYIYLSFS